MRPLRRLSERRRRDGSGLCGATEPDRPLAIGGGLLLIVLASIVPDGFRDNLGGQTLSMPLHTALPVAWMAARSLAGAAGPPCRCSCGAWTF